MDETGNGADAPLLNNFIDYRGRPVLRSKSGCWRSAYFIIGVEVAERFAYYGISSNLITYLTGPLGQSTTSAAENVNVWSGTASLLPLIGAFIADAFLGRYPMIIISSLLYILALGLLSLSTLLPSDCENAVGDSSCSPRLKVILFFASLYLVAFAQGGHKPCVQAFGADQFDVDNPEERKAKSSFFNWWFFGMCIGPTVGISVLSYIQENLSWGLGFGIPCIIMGFSLIIFLFGTVTYRFGEKTYEKNAFVRIGHVFLVAAQNWRTKPSAIDLMEEARGIVPQKGSQTFRFLDKALVARDGSNDGGSVCSIDEVEEAKAVLRLIPVWLSCLGYAIVYAQSSTFFTKQGATMNRSIGSTFEIPPATLQSFIALTIVTLIPIYATVLVPLARAITRKPSGITTLQRIGTGIVISIVAMVVAALVETKRLRSAGEHGSGAVVPMTIWWLLPQYLLVGASEVFTVVGIQEFFYDQVPSDLRSIGLALYLSIFGIGSFLSSFVISVVEEMSGWMCNNLNEGHLDYFYYLLAGISGFGFVIYVYVAKSYVYNNNNQGRPFSGR